MAASFSRRGRGFPWGGDQYDSDQSEESLEIADSNPNSFNNGIGRSSEDNISMGMTAPISGTRYSPEHSTLTDTDYFPHPVFYRVLCMGTVSQPVKTEVVKKIGKGLIQVLKNDSSGLMPISRFKEVKHHLVVLSLIGDRPNEIENMDSFEDNGASLIEADFTWDSNAFDIYADPHLEALHYAWRQTPVSQKFNKSWIEADIQNHTFNGFEFPDKTPDGIDLCIYFCGGDDDDERSTRDMDLLWKLSKLGVLILPIISVPNLSRSHVADRLSNRGIKCLDLTGIEMERPSFRNSHRVGRDGLNYTTPQLQPYEILDIDQFNRIQSRAIYELLKKSRTRMVTRTALKKMFEDAEPKTMTRSYEKAFGSIHHKKGFIRSILGLLVFAFIFIYFFYLFYTGTFTSPSNWIVSFEMDPDQQFLLYLKDENSQKFSWPKNDPQVWINSKELVRTERVSDYPGRYKVLFQINYSTIFFTINSTTKTDHYILTNNQTFIWLDKPTVSASDVIPDQNILTSPSESYWKAKINYLASILNHPRLFLKVVMNADDSE